MGFDMKVSIRRLAVFAGLVSLTGMSQAAGITSPLPVIGIDVGDTNAMIARVGGNTECGTPYAVVGNTQTYYKDVVALATAALATGQTVSMWVQSCDPNGRAVVARMVLGTVW